jgi:predicted transcriptional regulator
MVAKVIELSDEIQQQIADLARQTGRAETDLLHEAIATYVQARRVPRPRSDCAIDDPEFAAHDVDEWLAANWLPA